MCRRLQVKGSGLPVIIPVIDMIEIGAGGGSLAELDERGVIRVGPRSAGANPGPACYGSNGVRSTLTDANLALGYLGTLPPSEIGGRISQIGTLFYFGFFLLMPIYSRLDKPKAGTGEVA